MYTRTKCIWCDSTGLLDLPLPARNVPVASYTTTEPTTGVWIPYGVQQCSRCLAHQVKTLGDPAVVYGKNHAYSCGSTLRDMCSRFRDFVLANGSLESVLEIGAGNGFLADVLLEAQPGLEYTIVDPSYFGQRDNRTILPYFIEDDACPKSAASTLLMSHVFEHFYAPLDVLARIPESVTSVYLNFPNLESYVQNKTFHVLNLEHTFFVETQFLVKTFQRYGFTCVRQESFREHSVFLAFQRTTAFEPEDYTNSRSPELIARYFDSIQETVDRIQAAPDPVYLWPCSMHTQTVLSFGVDSSRVRGLLDNCESKHGTYLYGYSIPCLPFDSSLRPILVGGCFTRELQTASGNTQDPYHRHTEHSDSPLDLAQSTPHTRGGSP